VSAIEYEFGSTHYAHRRTRAALHIRGCRRKTHARLKADPTCGGAFKCGKCGALVGWCRGAYEDSPRDDWCDECWLKDDRAKERAVQAFNTHLSKLGWTTHDQSRKGERT
jgi:hypothetical protein